MAEANRSRMVLWLSSAVIGLLGLALAAGGGWLLGLGGSAYYLLAGLTLIAIALLLLARHPVALWLGAALVIGTLCWAIWETGFAWWPLVPRGDLVFLVGAWLLMPWVVRALEPDRVGKRVTPWRGGGLALSLSLVAALVVGVVAIFTPSDPLEVRGLLSMDAARPVGPDYAGVAPGDWAAYGHSNFGDRWSALTQITPANVGQLQVAWTYHTGDLKRPGDPEETTYELTPLKVGNRVYICTPHDWAIALDPDTGKQVWRFDPKIRVAPNLQHLTCRGVSYHAAAGPSLQMAGACPRRIFLPTADGRLFALNADSGQPCPGFGRNGAVDLWQGMPAPERLFGEYYSTSPPVVTRNLVIVSGEVTDNYATFEPSGVVRAYDVYTGRLVWNFDSGNPDQTAPIRPGQHYVHNSPNSWSISSADEALGMVYVPYGNQTPDQWGGNRGPNTERFASSITALDIPTGKVRWVFQTVHHDLWDMDVGSQPSLLDLNTPHGVVPALVAPTKTGNLFVLDRRSGQPVFPVYEKPVPQGAAPGDHTAPTQPFSSVSLMPKRNVRGKDLWGVTPFDQLACRIRFRSLRYDGPFTPPSTQGSLVFPGNFGVFDWGSIAVDPVRQIAFLTPTYMAFVDKLDPRSKAKAQTPPPNGFESSRETGSNPNFGAPFAADLRPFLSPLGLPCQAPPWGYVGGLNLRTGQLAYLHRNGTIRDVAPVPIPIKMGVPSLGGPIMTAGGVAFLTATLDYYVRAYSVQDGTQLWQARLPAGGQSTPMTYRSDATGRQYVLVVAGGHGSLGTKMGDSLIAYALPNGGKT